MENYEKCTAQKMKFSIKDFFSKCDQIRRKLGIWSHLLKKSLMKNCIFCVVVLKSVLVHENINYRNIWIGNWKLSIIDLIVNVILHYLKKTLRSLLTITTNIQECVLWKKYSETFFKKSLRNAWEKVHF